MFLKTVGGTVWHETTRHSLYTKCGKQLFPYLVESLRERPAGKLCLRCKKIRARERRK